MNNTIQRKQLGIYIHIPFCVRKCAYCDFLSGPADEETIEQYVRMLILEIENFGRSGKERFPFISSDPLSEYKVVSVFAGGGTPSVLMPEQIRRIARAVGKRFFENNDPTVTTKMPKHTNEMGQRESKAQCEITVECNPGTLTEEKLLAMKESGVNRLSIGLQSMQDAELKILGRIHDRKTFLENYDLARKTGFQNINIDLMSGLPGQTPADWEATLRLAMELKPEHISAYSLIIEEGTPFYDRYKDQDEQRRRTGEIGNNTCENPGSEGESDLHESDLRFGGQNLLLPNEDAEREMYALTEQILKENGMNRYEISNYALPGYESIHNSGYWKRTDYIGFGLGASSMLRNTRFKNTDDLKAYLEGKTVDPESVEELSVQEQMEETMFLGLRMMDGVSETDFREVYGTHLQNIYGDVLEKMEAQGLMRCEKGRWKLTRRGIDVSNVVMSEFLL